MNAGATLRESVLFRVDDDSHHVAGFRISPDGSRIAYLYAPRGVEVGSLWLFDRAGRERTALGRQDHGYWSPTWSPDGTTLAVCSTRTGAGEVWLLPLGGGPHRLLTAQGANVAQAAWSPGDDRIAFLSNATGAYELWLARADCAEAACLTDQELWVDPFPALGDRAGACFAWSPDGARLAFSASRRSGDDDWNTEVWMHELATGRAERIFARKARTRDDCALLDLSFSPDGRHLAFRRCIGEKYHLLVVSAAGKRVLKRKYIGSLSSRPWSSDGGRLVCSAEPGLLEVHDLRAGSTALLRESGGLHRFRAPSFAQDDRLVYGRGAALACLVMPDSAAEFPFTLDPDPPPATRPEVAHRDSTAWDLARLRRDLEEMTRSGRVVGDEVACAAAHMALQPAVHGLLAALPREALDPLLADTLRGRDPVALETVLTGLAEREYPCGPQVLGELAAALEPDRRLTPGVRAGVLRLLSDRGLPPRDELVRTALADPHPAVRAAGAYASLRGPQRDEAAVLTALSAPASPTWVTMDLPDREITPGRRHVWRDIVGARSRGDAVALSALLALRRAHARPGPNLLTALVAHRDDVVRVWAIHYLADLAPESSAPQTALHDDPSPAVRSAAITAAAAQNGTPPPVAAFVGDVAATLARESYGESDYWEVRIRGALRCSDCVPSDVTLSLDVADRCQVLEWPALTEGETRSFEFFYSLALWEAVPEEILLLIETQAGARTVLPIPVSPS